ncbi:myeloid cell surface antigen CD33-like [Petaurus breviceps papuanus]|uniref:myeloid cell surface antigen CD33-like n=1 Tax=Petaurus breviceps papuanus TaxID=3040969 RepID=UPI0036DA560F
MTESSPRQRKQPTSSAWAQGVVNHLAFPARAYPSTGSEMLLLPLIFQTLGGSLSQMPGYKLEVPEAVTVQEGLCIQVPCSFSYPSDLQLNSSEAFGYWFKNGRHKFARNKPVATNDAQREVQQETRGIFHLIGDPLDNNCSLGIMGIRKRDSGQYFFRIERGMDLKYTYIDYMVNVSVKDPTQKPNIYIQGTLEPGHLVKVICVAPSVFECGKPTIFSWTGAILSSLEFSSETPNFSELALTARPQYHGSNLTCQVSVPGTRVNLQRTVHLSVTYRNGVLTFSKGIFLGAGIMALLALSLILALMRFLKKKQVKDSDPQHSKEVPDAKEVSRGVHLDQHRGPSFPLCSPVTQAPSEEIHYPSHYFSKISP